MTTKDMNTLAEFTGTPSEVHSYCRGRKCRICKHTLGTYTPGHFCLAHQFQGSIMEMEEATRKTEKKQARYRKMMKKKADAARKEKVNAKPKTTSS